MTYKLLDMLLTFQGAFTPHFDVSNFVAKFSPGVAI